MLVPVEVDFSILAIPAALARTAIIITPGIIIHLIMIPAENIMEVLVAAITADLTEAAMAAALEAGTIRRQRSPAAKVAPTTKLRERGRTHKPFFPSTRALSYALKSATVGLTKRSKSRNGIRMSSVCEPALNAICSSSSSGAAMKTSMP